MEKWNYEDYNPWDDNPCVGCWFYEPELDRCSLPSWEPCPDERSSDITPDYW